LQLRLARSALKLGVRELAEAAGVSPTTVTRFESGRGGVQSGTLGRLETALEARGVVFVPADANGGATIRLRD
jgi:transcriptional regulator with XRE-family HTH domain